MAIIECVPNLSEGRDAAAVEAIAAAVRGVAGRPAARRAVRRHASPLGADLRRRSRVRCWRRCSRCSKRRCRASTCAAIAASTRGSAPSTSCRSCPIDGATMADCVALAREAGAAVAERFGVPVFLYEEAASTPARRNLEDIRRGEFEGLAAKLQAAGVGARLRSGGAARQRRRDRDRRADAAHRLQHQPGDRSARRRQAHRRRGPHELGRLPLRQGDGHRARGSRHRAGLDEPHQLREDADLPGVRDRQARGGALRRDGAGERGRRAGAGRGAGPGGGVLPAARGLPRRAGARKPACAAS